MQASAVSYDQDQPCCCVVIEGQKIFAHIIIASSDVAPNVSELDRSTRVMQNAQTTMLATGCQWLLAESMLCHMLQLHNVLTGRNHDSRQSQTIVHTLSQQSSHSTVPLSPCASDMGSDRQRMTSMSRPRRALTMTA